MFTGIVMARGRVANIERDAERLAITVEATLDGLERGESIAVDGACLTIVACGDGWFRVDAVVTTRGRTRFGELAIDDLVNLERSLPADGRFGGHIVQGHVDGLGTVIGVQRIDDALVVDVRVPDDVFSATVLHGSIALDGVSLTVNAMSGPDTVQVSLIPFTLEHTTLGGWQVGDRVHVEGDVLGKYVRQLLRPWEQVSGEVIP